MFLKKGSILIYAIILVNLVVFLAFMIFSRSEILLKNANFQEYNAKLLKNIDEKMQLVVKYDAFVNSNGSWFVDTRTCPTVTLTPPGTDFITSPEFSGGSVSCNSWVLKVDYTLDGGHFKQISYSWSARSIIPGITSTWTFLSGINYSFALPSQMSWIDKNFDSDNHSPYSTGSIRYPWVYQDDDALAREVVYGYVRRNGGWYNVFWNSSPMANFIASIPVNSDIYHQPIATSTGARLYLDIDQPTLLRVITFSSWAYTDASELKRLADVQYSITTSWFGYLQSDSSLSGSLQSSYGANPVLFDLKNNNYALFLSYSWATSWVADFLTYKLRFTGASWSWIYIVPLDDTKNDFFTFLWSDIIIDAEWNFLSRQLRLIKAK